MTQPAATFSRNLRRLWRHYSTLVVGAVTAAGAWWLQQTPETQTALLTAYPWLREAVPLGSFVAFVLAKAVPQPPKDKP